MTEDDPWKQLDACLECGLEWCGFHQFFPKIRDFKTYGEMRFFDGRWVCLAAIPKTINDKDVVTVYAIAVKDGAYVQKLWDEFERNDVSSLWEWAERELKKIPPIIGDEFDSPTSNDKQ